MDQKTHEIRLAEWKPIIMECRASGLSIKEWCSKNGVNAKKFYYWQRRLRAAATGEVLADVPNFQPLATTKKKQIIELPKPVSIPVQTAAPITIHINGLTMEINNTATPELITTIMQMMKHA